MSTHVLTVNNSNPKSIGLLRNLWVFKRNMLHLWFLKFLIKLVNVNTMMVCSIYRPL